MTTLSVQRAAHWLATLVVALSLSACALPRMIDSDVESFVGAAGATQGASYRFERLPSQQAHSASQDHLERLAEAALGRAGLVRQDAQARYSVLVEVRIHAYHRDPQPPHRSTGAFIAADGSLFYPAPLLLLEPPWYRHTVHLLLRDIGSAQVAFESTASFDGPWSDSANLLPAILDAALRDYPLPPTGVRKVVIELPAPTRETR